MEPTKESATSTPVKAPRNKKIELNLMGQKIVLRTLANAEQTEAVAALVRERLRAAEGRMKAGAAPHLAAVLALFDLAEEYVEAKQRVQSHQGDLTEKVSRLRVMLDE